MPVGYDSGMSQPPNGTIFAPRRAVHRVERAALQASPAIRRRAGPAAGVEQLGLHGDVGVDRAVELQVELLLHAAEGEHVEHALAAAAHHVDQLVAVAQHHVAAADHEVRGGDVGVDVLAQVLERLCGPTRA